ncbi:L-threonylcarbamoyladenylate synthase [Marinicrinis sediminis]|uniref:Threonylcarbamoyl-AMP synthase n=1 Tax=Marinicrinis sediminis TaxID=1652465 RepID=A0ABW5RAS7_9BACL
MTTYDVVDERDENEMKEAARLLREGGIVAFPTETVYGLGANARMDKAVERIFAAKGRPADNPLIVHVAHMKQLEGWADTSHPYVKQLADACWPGPLTIVLPVRQGYLSARVTAGLSTVGVRIPQHPVAIRLLELADCPVAAPSANRSGKPSPTRAAHVLDDLSGLVDAVVDGGSCEVGVESTVVELKDNQVMVLRPGGVSIEQLQHVLPHAEIISEQEERSKIREPETPRSPGMKYAHYAPNGALTVVTADRDWSSSSIPESENWSRIQQVIQQEIRREKEQGRTTGILAFDEHIDDYQADFVQGMGSLSTPEQAATRLYDALRAMDGAQIEVIYAEGCPRTGIGLALMNRLQKAAADRIIDVSERDR